MLILLICYITESLLKGCASRMHGVSDGRVKLVV